MPEGPWHPFRRTGCGMRGTLSILSILTMLILVPTLWVHELSQLTTQNATTSTTLSTITPTPVTSVVAATPGAAKPNSVALRRSNRSLKEKSISLTFIEGKTRTAVFDFCSLVHCRTGRTNPTYQQTSAKYLCLVPPSTENRDIDWPDCPWQTQDISWGITNHRAEQCRDQEGRPLSTRLKVVKGHTPQGCSKTTCNPILLTLTNPQHCDGEEMYRMYSWESGTDPWGQIRIYIQRPPKPKPTSHKEGHSPTDGLSKNNMVTYLDVTSLKDRVAVETGYDEKNEWLNWLYYTARQNGPRADCLACAAARPTLGTVPFPLNPNNDPEGFRCILKLYASKTVPECASLDLLFPPTSTGIRPPVFTPYDGNYTCVTRTGEGPKVGNLQHCQLLIDVLAGEAETKDEWLRDQRQPRADVWWYCGGKTLFDVLPRRWVGTCALVQLVMPFYVMPMTDEQLYKFRTQMTVARRTRRDLGPAGSFDSQVYFDAIGVPRGVPDQYKARNQVAAGFESLIFWWATINKNVDWINYIYYNQQRFINFTRDGIKGLAEQLDKTSLMAWQNRMALDMLLAEKGGVCRMFGDVCCTFIPNNTAPDGSVTKALNGLTALSKEFAENAGIYDPFTAWMEDIFGTWTGVIQSVLLSLAVMVSMLAACGCCCIPFLRGLAQRLIETAMTKTILYTEMNDCAQAESGDQEVPIIPKCVSCPTDSSDSDGEDDDEALYESVFKLYDDTYI